LTENLSIEDLVYNFVLTRIYWTIYSDFYQIHIFFFMVSTLFPLFSRIGNGPEPD